ncbi:MAG: AAA family ATPase [Victivallales bacterium]|nr:AAA family ATPase [Victivallales bacterium]
MAYLQYRNEKDEYAYVELPSGGEMVFGRDDDADFIISDDDLVSRHHFSICRGKDGECVLKDLGARNGTSYNGKPLEAESVILSEGDRIRAGKKIFLYFEKMPVAADASKSVIQLTPFATNTFGSHEEAMGKIDQVKTRFVEEMRKVIVGQEEVVAQIMVALLARGHCLLVGVPGLAKTLMVKVLAGVLDLETNRIQFTPDLMPSDITGTDILEEDEDHNRRFRFKFGPVFTNILLADEINRTPPKTQAALLEAMQEQRVTASGVTYNLPDPFLVLATQNPIEQEGTYPLPEAQLDRFMFCIRLDYPKADDEEKIITDTTSDFTWEVQKILGAEAIIKLQHLVRQVPVSKHVAKYATSLVRATRPGYAESPEFVNRWLRWGAGPRAGQYLLFAAKAHALLQGRFSVSCADVREYAPSVLRHRLFCNFTASSEGVDPDKVISKVLETVREPDYA